MSTELVELHRLPAPIGAVSKTALAVVGDVFYDIPAHQAQTASDWAKDLSAEISSFLLTQVLDMKIHFIPGYGLSTTLRA